MSLGHSISQSNSPVSGQTPNDGLSLDLNSRVTQIVTYRGHRVRTFCNGVRTDTHPLFRGVCPASGVR